VSKNPAINNEKGLFSSSNSGFFILLIINSSVSKHNAQLNCVESWRAFWNKKRDRLRSQIAAAC
jgi:hypothetical protein